MRKVISEMTFGIGQKLQRHSRMMAEKRATARTQGGKLGTCILSEDLLVHWLARTLAGNQKLKCDMSRHALFNWSLAGCTSTGIGGLCRAPERKKDSEKEKEKERARVC